jgi:hypothetical protein
VREKFALKLNISKDLANQKWVKTKPFENKTKFNLKNPNNFHNPKNPNNSTKPAPLSDTTISPLEALFKDKTKQRMYEEREMNKDYMERVSRYKDWKDLIALKDFKDYRRSK